MAPRTKTKLYLLGGLSVVSIVLGALVLAALIPADNRQSVGLQYLFVGGLLAALFLSLGGFSALKSLLRPAPTLPSSGRDSEIPLPDPEEPAPVQDEGRDKVETPPGRPVSGFEVGAQTGAIEDTGGSASADVESLPGGAGEDDPAIEKPPAVEVLEVDQAGRYLVEPLGQSDLDHVRRWGIADQVIAVVRQNEAQLIDRLIDAGLLTTEGPINDRDVRAMVWVAVSSIELADSLLTEAAVDPTAAALPAVQQAETLPRPEIQE